MGEADWKSMSEKRRQARVIQLKLQERRMMKEGKYVEAAALLGRLMEDDKGEYTRWQHCSDNSWRMIKVSTPGGSTAWTTHGG